MITNLIIQNGKRQLVFDNGRWSGDPYMIRSLKILGSLSRHDAEGSDEVSYLARLLHVLGPDALVKKIVINDQRMKPVVKIDEVSEIETEKDAGDTARRFIKAWKGHETRNKILKK